MMLPKGRRVPRLLMLLLWHKNHHIKDFKRHAISCMSFSFLALFVLFSALLTGGCSPAKDIIYDIQQDYTEDEIGKPKDVVSISEGRIAYETLSEEEKKCYDEILDCILNHDESCALCIYDENEVGKAYEAVFADYGGLFWVVGYSYKTFENSDGTKIGFEFTPTYSMDRSERDNTQNQIDAAVDVWLSELPADADDYTKSKFVFESLINKVDYDISSENNQNIISVFLGNATVCQGYADAASYLFDELAIPSMVISGDANGQAHAWNLVQLDGEYYYIDVTWGNSTYMTSQDEYTKHINYAYLNVTGDDIQGTHTLKTSLEPPAATGTQDNYFHREGTYFDTWDDNAIGMAISDAYYSGTDFFSIRFANDTLYDTALDYFIGQQFLFNYCQGLSSVNYIEDKELNVITINYP